MAITRISKGDTHVIFNEDWAGADTKAKFFTTEGDSLIVSLWVESGGVEIDVITYANAGQEKILLTLTQATPTTELVLTHALPVLTNIKFVVRTTGAAKFDVRARAIDGIGDVTNVQGAEDGDPLNANPKENYQILNILVSAADTQIDIPACISYTYRSRKKAKLEIRKSAAAVNYFTSLPGNRELEENINSKPVTLFVTSSKANDELEIIYWT